MEKKWVYSCDKCTKFYVGESAGSSLRSHKFRKHSYRTRRVFTATEAMDSDLPSSQMPRRSASATVTRETAETSSTVMMEGISDPENLMINAPPGSTADLTRILQDLPDVDTVSTTSSWNEYLTLDMPTLEDIIDVDALFSEGLP